MVARIRYEWCARRRVVTMTANEPRATMIRPTYNGAELPDPVGGSSPIVDATTAPVVGAAVGGGSVVGVDSGAQFGAMMMVCACVADKVGVLESATMTLKSNVPGVVGVPVMVPSAAAKLRPGGKVPDATDQVNGAVPPSTPNTLAE